MGASLNMGAPLSMGSPHRGTHGLSGPGPGHAWVLRCPQCSLRQAGAPAPHTPAPHTPAPHTPAPLDRSLHAAAYMPMSCMPHGLSSSISSSTVALTRSTESLPRTYGGQDCTPQQCVRAQGSRGCWGHLKVLNGHIFHLVDDWPRRARLGHRGGLGAHRRTQEGRTQRLAAHHTHTQCAVSEACLLSRYA